MLPGQAIRRPADAVAEQVVIIGGGFTGLITARTLARSDARLQLTLLESGPALGGLAAGFPLCGTHLEKSYHYLLSGDSEMLSLVRELGLERELMYRTGLMAIYDGSTLYPFTTLADVLRFSPCTVMDRLRFGLTILRLKHLHDWRPLASQSARDWLERAGGPGVMRAVWNPLLRGKFDRYWDQVSMAWLWARIHTRANSRAGGREQGVYLRSGFVGVVRQIETELVGAGVTLRKSARVERIEVQPRQVVLANGETIPYDRCLFTGPSDSFARLLPAEPALDDYRRQLQSIIYLGAVCVVLVSDQALGRHHWTNIHDPAAPFLVMINHTELVGTELYGGKHVYYLGCYRPHDSPVFAQDDETLLREWLAYLRRMYPDFDPSRLQERYVFRFRNAQHVVDCGYAQRIPEFRTPLPGVYLANFSQIFPYDRGTNFAVRDGVALANLILEDVGHQSKPAAVSPPPA